MTVELTPEEWESLIVDLQQLQEYRFADRHDTFMIGQLTPEQRVENALSARDTARLYRKILTQIGGAPSRN